MELKAELKILDIILWLHLYHSNVTAAAPLPQDGEVIYKDWVFINYTFKRFEGLTQRGTPTKK